MSGVGVTRLKVTGNPSSFI